MRCFNRAVSQSRTAPKRCYPGKMNEIKRTPFNGSICHPRDRPLPTRSQAMDGAFAASVQHAVREASASLTRSHADLNLKALRWSSRDAYTVERCCAMRTLAGTGRAGEDGKKAGMCAARHYLCPGRRSR
jgi:hypothetical protein